MILQIQQWTTPILLPRLPKKLHVQQPISTKHNTKNNLKIVKHQDNKAQQCTAKMVLAHGRKTPGKSKPQTTNSHLEIRHGLKSESCKLGKPDLKSLCTKMTGCTQPLSNTNYPTYPDPLQDPSLSSQCRHKINIKPKNTKIWSVSQSSRLSYLSLIHI